MISGPCDRGGKGEASFLRDNPDNPASSRSQPPAPSPRQVAVDGTGRFVGGGTARDLVKQDGTVAAHLQYDAFGRVGKSRII